MLGEQRDGPPDRHQDSDDHEKSNATGPIVGALDSGRRPPLAMSPPGKPVAHEKGEPQPDDELGEQVLEVEDVAHSGHANPE